MSKLSKEEIRERNKIKYAKDKEYIVGSLVNEGSYNITIAERNKVKWINDNLILYKLEMIDVDGTIFYKIGLTNNIKNRLQKIPYECKIVKQLSVDKYEAIYMEKYCLTEQKEKKYIPLIHFKGYSECYN